MLVDHHEAETLKSILFHMTWANPADLASAGIHLAYILGNALI